MCYFTLGQQSSNAFEIITAVLSKESRDYVLGLVVLGSAQLSCFMSGGIMGWWGDLGGHGFPPTFPSGISTNLVRILRVVN